MNAKCLLWICIIVSIVACQETNQLIEQDSSIVPESSYPSSSTHKTEPIQGVDTAAVLELNAPKSVVISEKNVKPKKVVDPEYTKIQLEHKVIGYTIMNNVGIGIMATGGAGVVVGLVFGIHGGIQMSQPVSSLGDAIGFGFGAMEVAYGVEIGAIGLLVAGAGTVVKVIGGLKKTEYSERLKVCVTGNSVRLCLEF